MKKGLIIFSLTTLCATSQAQEGWTLRQCIDYAIEHNIEIQQTANAAEQSAIEANTAKWARLPNLSGSASQSWNWGRSASPEDIGGYTNSNTSSTQFGINTNIPLFTGLQIPNQYALSKLNLKAAIEDLNKAKEDIAINVTSSYLQVLFNMELSKVAASQTELSKEQCKRITRLAEVGKASSAEVAEAKARVAQDEMSLVQAENNYQLALLDLSQLLELPTPEGFTLAQPDTIVSFIPLTPPDDIYTEALSNKPGIRAAQLRLEGSEKNIRIAQSNYYPQLSFGASIGTNYYTVDGHSKYGFSSQMRNNLSKGAGFNLSIPLFNRLATRNRVRSARLQQTNLALKLDNTKKVLYKEIQQAWYNAVAAESKFNSSTAAVAANEESFRLMSEKFDNGKATFVEYNEAKQNLTKSLSDKIQAKYDYLFRTKILDFYKGKAIE
ncbi:TolC family protein [Bacteroides nordii]|jgi:hypothetical protein|uniref:TolC family protein n=1 Tax=Bacteroides nordii TaxID=291645 RepID=UPI002109ED48|nr:TolC family protein [Bacteroides nordii]MCQ4915353.1 TolC family protein [Bacteroides nordii]